MRVYYDFEFLEHQVRYGVWPRRRSAWTIDPISVGIKADDGREYYAVFRDAPWNLVRKNEWLMGNVVPQLPRLHGDQRNHAPQSWLFNMADKRVKPTEQITREVAEFLLATPDLQLWGWYSAFDHVALAWLWGRMVNLPEGIPKYTGDLRSLAQQLGDPQMPRQEHGEHNALEDARENERKAHQLDRLARHLEAFDR